jgi:hypothetical protein
MTPLDRVDALRKLIAVHARHHDIGKYRVEIVCSDLAKRVMGVGRRLGAITQALDQQDGGL